MGQSLIRSHPGKKLRHFFPVDHGCFRYALNAEGDERGATGNEPGTDATTASIRFYEMVNHS